MYLSYYEIHISTVAFVTSLCLFGASPHTPPSHHHHPDDARMRRAKARQPHYFTLRTLFITSDKKPDSPLSVPDKPLGRYCMYRGWNSCCSQFRSGPFPCTSAPSNSLPTFIPSALVWWFICFCMYASFQNSFFSHTNKIFLMSCETWETEIP